MARVPRRRRRRPPQEVPEVPPLALACRAAVALAARLASVRDAVDLAAGAAKIGGADARDLGRASDSIGAAIDLVWRVARRELEPTPQASAELADTIGRGRGEVA